MLEVDFDDLDLGSKRKPTEWVAVLPPSAQQPRQRSSRQMLKAQKKQQAHRKLQDDKPQGAVKKPGMPSTHAARMQQLAQCTDVRQPRPISEEDAAAGAHAFPAENDEGNVEYKLRLKEPNCSPVRFQQLVTQMKYRLAEGNGECFYFIGVEDDGYPRGLTQTDMDTSLATLRAMAEEVQAATTLLRKPAGTRKRLCAIVRVHKLCLDDVTYTDLRIAVAGSVDAGKSSLVGVLTHGIDGRPLLDNGSGSARMNVFQHKHEIETGRTSSLSQQMLGYDEQGKVLNYAGVSVLTPAEMSASARRVLRFIDLGGHEKYLKTALYGMTCMLPDYVVVCVCPLAGLSRVSHEHLAVALALEVPVACVITKADVAPPEAMQQVLSDVRRVISAAAEVCAPHHAEGASTAAPLVNTEEQAVKLAGQLGDYRRSQAIHAVHKHHQGSPSGLVVPVFVMSSVTGLGLPVLHAFLNALPALPHTATPLVQSAVEARTTAQESSPQNSEAAGAQHGGALADCAGPAVSDAQADHPVDTPIENGMTLGRTVSVQPAGPQVAATHFQVDHTFEVKGVGCVVSGTVVSGSVAVGQRLELGPTGQGLFSQVEVTCIHRSQVPVRHVRSGQHATVALHPCHLPLHPSQATQQFSQPPQVSLSAPTPNTDGCTVHQQASLPVGLQGDMQQQQQVMPQQQQQQTEGSNIAQQRVDGSSIAQRVADGCSTVQHATGGSSIAQHDSAAAPRGLPAGLMSQALQRQSQTAEQAPWQQHHRDPYVLDHRIHHQAEEERAGQQQPAATAVVCHANSVRSAAPVTVPSLLTHSDTSELPRSEGLSVVGAVSSSPALAGAVPSSSALAGPAPPNARKGMVLLDAAMHTRTVWEFQAVIVLLNGHWPPRGLLSGRWPPKPNTPDTVLPSSSLPDYPLGASDSDPDMMSQTCQMQQQADVLTGSKAGGITLHDLSGSGSVGRACRLMSRPSKKRLSAMYTPVIHCGSVRQAAQVVVMEELSPSSSKSSGCRHMVDGCDLTSAVAAAAAMQDCTSASTTVGNSQSGSNISSDGSGGEDQLACADAAAVGTLARVVFKFQHRPEWLMRGSRIVVRDRTDGCIAGAGVLQKLFFVH